MDKERDKEREIEKILFHSCQTHDLLKGNNTTHPKKYGIHKYNIYNTHTPT